MNQTYAAGILFFYRSKTSKKIYFLLGKDFRYKWSDFGGKQENIDNMKPIKTAVRECYEETLGVILDKPKLVSILQKNPKCVIGKSFLKKDYYMYLIELNNYIDYNYNFLLIRNNIKTLESHFKEKLQLKWFSFDEILENKNDKFRNVFFQTVTNNTDTILDIINTALN